MQANSALQKTNSEMGVRQLRLATGSRLNRAEDDSAGFSIANKLQAKTRGQAQALSNIGDAKGMLTVGEGALNSTMDILQTMKEKAVQAANDTMGADERTAISNQLVELRKEIGDTLAGAEYNGTKLFGDGSGTGDTTDLNFQVGAGNAAEDSFAVSIGEMNSEVLQLDNGAYDIDADTDSTWGNGANTSIVDVAQGTYAGTAKSLTFAISDITGQNITFDVTDSDGNTSQYIYDATSGAGASLDTSAVGSVAEGLTINFEDTAGAAINATANAAGNFENGDTFTIDIQKGGLDVSDNANAKATIANIDAAIDTVNSAVSSLGDSQARLSIKQDNLDTSMTNYEAARSRIQDTDFAKEQMEITKLQILQQTGIGSLAQANAGPQSVLSLIG
jgi:flagellin